MLAVAWGSVGAVHLCSSNKSSGKVTKTSPIEFLRQLFWVSWELGVVSLLGVASGL